MDVVVAPVLKLLFFSCTFEKQQEHAQLRRWLPMAAAKSQKQHPVPGAWSTQAVAVFSSPSRTKQKTGLLLACEALASPGSRSASEFGFLGALAPLADIASRGRSAARHRSSCMARKRHSSLGAQQAE